MQIRYGVFLGAFLTPLPWLEAGEPAETPVVLHIEKAADLAGPWEVVPPESMARTADGGMMDWVTWPEAWYRLVVEPKDPSGEPLELPVGKVPPEVLGLATEHLDSLRIEEPDWADAELGPVVIPVYNPAVADGAEPAYYEFKVVGLSPQPEPPDQPAFGLSTPVAESGERGYILVTNGRHDVPVPQYATRGRTRGEELIHRAGGVAKKLLRYGSGFWVAEDEKEQLRASIGSTPYRMPPEILDWKGRLQTTEILQNDRWQESPEPPLQPVAFGSYAEFKDAWVNGPVYTWLRQAMTKRVAIDWAAIDDVEPPNIKIPVMEDTLVLQDMQVASWEFEDNLVASWKEPKGGLWLNGSLDDVTMMTVIDEAGDIHYYVLTIGDPQEQLGWRPWHTYYAVGSCAFLPRYTQVRGLSGCCPDGASGCGPTAWAIFYGFWDMRGPFNLIGGSEWTPYTNNSDVHHCIRRTFDLTGCWCTAINGQAATNPWQMDEGDAYAAERGESIDASISWCVPLTSHIPRRLAQDGIRNQGRPAIVGTGFFSHYPVAYAYRFRRYRSWGITWWTQTQWKVYQGWGHSHCEWVDSTTCWFGMNGQCY